MMAPRDPDHSCKELSMNLAVPPVAPPTHFARGAHPFKGFVPFAASSKAHLSSLSTSLESPRPRRRALLALCVAGCALSGSAFAALPAVPFVPPLPMPRTRVGVPAARLGLPLHLAGTSRSHGARFRRLVPVLASKAKGAPHSAAAPVRWQKWAGAPIVASRLGRIARPSFTPDNQTLVASLPTVAALPELSQGVSMASLQTNAERLRLSRLRSLAAANGLLASRGASKGAPVFPGASISAGRFPAFRNSTFAGVQALPELAPASIPSGNVPSRVQVVTNAGGGKMIQFRSSATITTGGGAANNVAPLVPPLPLPGAAGQMNAKGMKKVIRVPGLSLPPLSQPLPDWMQAASVRVDRLEKAGKTAKTANGKRFAQNPGGAPVRRPTAPVTNSDRLSNQIEVSVSTFVVLLTTTDLQTVAVADPSVADVAVVNSRSVLLNGKAPGVTSLVIVDGQKIRQYSVRVTAGAGKTPRDIAAAIGIPGVSVRPLGEALLLEGEVATPDDSKHAAEIAGVYAPKVINQLSIRSVNNAAQTSTAQLSDLLSDYPGVKARLAGDTVILTGEVSDPNQMHDAETVAGATGRKVVNLIRLPAMSVAQLQQSLGAVDTAPSLSTPGQLTEGAPITVRELGGQLVLEGFAPSQGDIDIAVASARRTGLPVVNRLQVRPALSSDQVLSSEVAAAIGRPGITVRGTTKRLVLEGIVNDTNEAVLAEQVARAFTLPGIGQVDNLLQTKAPVQVNVDVTIAELNSNDARALGVQYGSVSLIGEGVTQGSPSTTVATPNGPITTAATPGITTRTINPTFNPGIALAGNGFVGLGGTGFIDPFRARINALLSNNRGHILSAPSTTVLSGRTATFQVGGQVPIPGISTTGANGQTTAIVFKDYGILLDVVPNALPNGVVTLRIRTEVSQPDFANGVQQPGGGIIPGFQRRSTVTEVTVPPNGVLSLSGLITSQDTRTETGVPILSRIPILGALFRSKDFRTNKTELVIFVRPHVLPNPLTGDQLAPAAVVAEGENSNFATRLGNPGLLGFDAGGASVLAQQSGGGR